MTTRFRGPDQSSAEIRTATVVVTLGSIATLPDGAPSKGTISSPTETDISHQPSAHARTPRVAHVSAYSANARAAAFGIAPKELEMRYVVFSRIGNWGLKRRRGSGTVGSGLTRFSPFRRVRSSRAVGGHRREQASGCTIDIQRTT